MQIHLENMMKDNTHQPQMLLDTLVFIGTGIGIAHFILRLWWVIVSRSQTTFFLFLEVLFSQPANLKKKKQSGYARLDGL